MTYRAFDTKAVPCPRKAVPGLLALLLVATAGGAGVGCGGDGAGGTGGFSGTGGSGAAGGSGGAGGNGGSGGSGGSGGAGSTCDIYKNSGCAAGFVCGVSRTNMPICDGAGGKKLVAGDSCMEQGMTDECAGGLFCATVDPTEKVGFRCYEPCMMHSDCSSKIQKCQLRLHHGGQSWQACSDACRAWSQNSCQTSEQCVWSKEGGAECVTTKGTKKIGDACASKTECAPGLLCFESVCRESCVKPDKEKTCEERKCTTGSMGCVQPEGSGLGPMSEDPCLGVCL